MRQHWANSRRQHRCGAATSCGCISAGLFADPLLRVADLALRAILRRLADHLSSPLLITCPAGFDLRVDIESACRFSDKPSNGTLHRIYAETIHLHLVVRRPGSTAVRQCCTRQDSVYGCRLPMFGGASIPRGLLLLSVRFGQEAAMLCFEEGRHLLRKPRPAIKE